MMMDAVEIGTLPTSKQFLSNKIYESTDSSKDKIDDSLFTEENEDDEIRLRLSDEEEIEQENISSNVQNQQANSQLKKDDSELNSTATVNPEDTSEVRQQESKDKASSVDQVETPVSVNPEQASEVYQQELKDKAASVDQVEATVSVNSEKASEVCQQELEDTNSSIEQDKSLSGSDLDEEFLSDNLSASDEESTMGDRIPHNPTKYWSSFDPRPWKGNQRKRLSFPHRGSKSWYHQQYPDRDKLKKNNLHHSNSHFIRSSRSRASFNSPARANLGTDAKKDEASGSLRLKKSSKDISSNKDQMIKQNGVSNGLDHKENNSSSQNDKLPTLMNKGDKVGMKSIDQTSASQSKRSLDSKLSSEQNRKGNGNDSSVKLLNGIVTAASASITKDCDLSTTAFDKGKQKTNVTESSSHGSAVDSMKTPRISEVMSEAQIQIKDVTSQNNGILDDKCKDIMEIDDNVNEKPDSTSDLICIESNIKDFSEKVGKSDEFSCGTIVRNKNIVTETITLENEDEHNKPSDSVPVKEKQPLENGKTMSHSVVEPKDDSVKNYKSMDVDINTDSSQKFNNEDDSRDSESSSLVIDESNQAKETSPVDKENAEAAQTEDGKTAEIADKSASAKKDQNSLNNVIEEVDLIDDDSQDANLKSSNVDTNISNPVPIETKNGDKVEESNQEGRAVVHKRRRRKRLVEAMQEEMLAHDIEIGGRQKRRSARNAEEMIRKEILKGDNEEEDSSDDADKLVKVNYRKSLPPNIITRQLSPPTLKRTIDELSDEKDNAATTALKRVKPNTTEVPAPVAEERKELSSSWKSIEQIAATSELARKISQEDIRRKLRKLSQEELEALLLQKVVECITVRGEMGKLREQARASKKSHEAIRNKCLQLQKQVEGFEMVLKRINYDKNSNSDKYVPPIKINRSVGLQVNFLSQEHGVQNIKQIQAHREAANSANSSKQVPTSTATSAQENPSPRKMMKTRSPRRLDIPSPTIIQVSAASSSATTQTINPATTVMMTAKPVDPSAKRTITVQNGNVLQIVSPTTNQPAVTTRPATLTIQRTPGTTATKSNDLIDLTDEEDKSKVSALTPIAPAAVSGRMTRVIQAVPTTVALSNAANYRLVPAANSQAALSNGVTRLAYVMQPGPNGPTKQLVLTSNNSVKAVTSLTTTGGINYKRGVTTLPNGAVRLLTTQAPPLQITKHPAPLPETPMPASDPSWKLAPPAPSLKISKVATGIVLSWNMSLSDKYADIVSYQLYAYQEVTGTPPNANLWKKVGDVRALPLPMACTLTQFTEGNNYYFAVRAVDAHSRFGQYSKPGHISL